MSRCKDCGVELTWILMKGGKAMPCNPEPMYYKADPAGSAKIVTPDGRVLSAELCENKDEADGVGYISHFATCPGADRIRRR